MQPARPLNLTGWRPAALVFAAGLAAILVLTAEYFLPIGLIKLALAAVFACAFGLYIFAHPKMGLFAVVFYIYAGLGFYFPFPASYPIVIIVTAAVALRLLGGERIELRSPGFLCAMALFVLIATQSMLFAYDASLSFFEFTEVAKALLVVFLVVQLIRTPKDLHQFVFVIFLGGLASVLLGLMNYQLGLVTVDDVTQGKTGLRFTGTHGNPNEFAIFLATCLPIGIYLARKFSRWYSTTLIVIACVMMLLAIFGSFSRAAFIILGFIIVAILARDLRNRVVFALIVIAAGVVLVSIPGSYWDRLTTLTEIASLGSENWSLYVRLQSAIVAWKLFLAHPFTGIGLGNFILRSEPYFFHRMVVHNVYLQILVGVGIFGGIAYLAAQVSIVGHFVNAMKYRWSKHNESMSHLAFYLLVGFLSTVVGGLFGPTTFEYVTWLPAAGGLAAGRMALRAREGLLKDEA